MRHILDGCPLPGEPGLPRGGAHLPDPFLPTNPDLQVRERACGTPGEPSPICADYLLRTPYDAYDH
jgi:hypothetical protein